MTPSEREAKRGALLVEVARCILDGPLVSIPTRVFNIIRDHLQADFMLSYGVERDEQSLRLLDNYGVPCEELSKLETLQATSPLSRLLTTEGHDLIPYDPDLGRDAEAILLRETGVRAFVSYPFVSGSGEVVGSFAIGSTKRDSFDPSEVEFLRAISGFIALGLERHKTEERSVTAPEIEEQKRTEEALRASEARLRLFVQHVPVAIAMLDRDMRYLSVSGRWRSDYGLLNQDPIGRLHYDLIPEAERWREINERALQGEVIASEADTLTKADGTTLSIKWEVRPWRQFDGNVGGIVIFTEDITKRKRAEERARLAAAAAGIGYWWLNIETDETELDERTAALFGLSARNIPASEVILKVHPDDRARVDTALRRAVRQRERYHEEFRVVDEEGRVRWLVGHGDVVVDEGKQPTRLTGLNFDITERKRSEEELRTREEEFRTLADNISQLAWMAEKDGSVFWYNKRWFEYTGTSTDEMKGFGWEKIIEPKLLSDIRAKWRKAVESGERWEDTFPLRRYDGSMRWHLSRAIPIRDKDGEIVRWFGTNTDITEQKKLEDELRASESQLRTVTDVARVGLAIVNKNYTICFANQAYSDILGLPREKIVGHPLRDILGKDYGEEAGQCLQRAFSGERVGHELAIARQNKSDNELRYCTIAYEPYIDPSGCSEVVVVVVDITTRREAERGLEESEATLRAFYEASPALMGIVELTDDGDILHHYDNRATCEFFDLPAEGTKGKRARADLGTSQQSVENWRSHYEQSRKQGGPVWFEYRFEASPISRWLSAAVAPLPSVPGKNDRFCYIAEDITLRKQSEEALRERERQFQALADNSPDVLARFDREVRHVFVNAAVENATGRKAEEFIGRTFREASLPEEICVLFEAAVGAVFDEKIGRSIEYEFQSPFGKRYYTSRLVPELDQNGDVEYVLSVSTDHTARKNIENELLEADRRKDEFLATLAHELRNPLAPIRTGVQILKRTRDTRATEKAMNMMDRQLTHMVRLVDDLLDVSRISTGKIDLKLEWVDLHTVIESTLDAIKPSMEASKHTLVTHLPSNRTEVKADAVRLSQILSNLLHNAVKYTPEGGRIELSVEAREDAVTFRVTDSGVGISEEMLPKVFDMFTQVTRTIDRSQGGLGIGLALAQNLAKLHGGSITAESGGAGTGSTFTLTIPRYPVVMRDPNPLTATPLPRGSCKILVVDDNEDAAESLSMLLEMLGCPTRLAHNGPGALREAGDFRPDAIFLDIGLPGMNGYEVARAIRSNPELSRTKLIAVTGWGGQEDVREAKEAGFDLHLTKPVDADVVERMISHLTIES